MSSTAILFLFLAERQQFVSFLYGKVKHRFQIQHFTQCKFQSAEVPKLWSRGHHGTAQKTSTSLRLILKMLPPQVSKIQPITPDCTSYLNSMSISYSQLSLHAFKETQILNQVTVAGKCFIIGRNHEQDQTIQLKAGWVDTPELLDYNIIYLYNICAKDRHQNHFSFCCIFLKGVAVKWNVIFSENLTFKRKLSRLVHVNGSRLI